MSNTVQVVAHRGASARAPENTLAAFRLACAAGARWFEIDCRLSADGEVMVIHDATVDRTSNGAGEVERMTSEELRRLDAGSWKDRRYGGERIPTLAETLDLARDRARVLIELKPLAPFETAVARITRFLEAGARLADVAEDIRPLVEKDLPRDADLARRVLRAVRGCGMERSIVLQSFSAPVVALLRLEAPHIETALLDGVGREGAGRLKAVTRFLDVPRCNLAHEAVTPALVAALREEGRLPGAWTVDDPGRIRELAAMGIDMLITNVPRAALDALAPSI